MQQARFEVFAKTPETPVLRFWDEAGALVAARPLARADLLGLGAEVDAGYRAAAPDLAALGRRLYVWLDGPTERWLARARQGATGLAVQIDVDERLRHLPWELLCEGGSFLGTEPLRPFTPVRRVGATARRDERANRPLRVLFMACSAEAVQPVLDFEKEEGLILDATRAQSLELVVEESGSLPGLGERVAWFGAGHFDIFHLSGHADVAGPAEPGGKSRDLVRAAPRVQPIFVMEDEVGARSDATAPEIAGAFGNCWPRLVFLSGCRTGQAVERGALPSLCEALVEAGAPAVLGWALPVGDHAASVAAAELYRALAVGRRIDEAVALARCELHRHGFPDWHLLRLYTDATPLGELVTPPATRGRSRLTVPEAATTFLDARSAAGSMVEVCPRSRFVGRRRLLQRGLRVLRSVPGQPQHAEGLLLHGIGGLGKSSLAARLCERMTQHERIVWFGRFDQAEFLKVLSDRLADPEAIEVLNLPKLALEPRLRRLLQGPMATRPALFILDDFEHNLDLAADGRAVLRPAALAILSALLTAIRGTASESRVLVTSRYTFPLAGPGRLAALGLESMRGPDLEKKLDLLPSFRRDAPTAPELKERAQGLAAGNPRLLERLDTVIADAATDHEAILAALAATAEAFREEILLRTLLGQQDPSCRRLLALASTYELPVGRGAIEAVAAGTPLDPHLDRAAALGLVEVGQDPAAQAPRHFVSSLLTPLLEGELSASERVEACRRGARSLFQSWWVEADGVSLERGLEIHRLALAAGEKEIAVTVGDAIATSWVNSSRYREAVLLCAATRGLVDDYRILHTLARAEVVLGATNEARRHYDQAMAECPAVDEKTTPAILKERSGILFNLASLEQQQGDVERALALWQESLALLERIGDVKGKAATMAEMAYVIAQQGDVERALALWQESLALKERIGDVKGKAATLHNMAGVIAQQGDVERALALWQESLALLERIGDVQGKAATLHNMAGVIAQQGDVERALALWQESLALDERIGDVKGKAATLAQMAWAAGRKGDAERERELNLRAAAALASVRAWPDLSTVLNNLGTSEGPDAAAFLAQAVWLSVHVGVPLDRAVNRASALLMALGPEAEAAPLVAGAALLLARARGANHPRREEIQAGAVQMLAACAEARGIPPDQFGAWFTGAGLGDAGRLLPALDGALEAIVGDRGWLFDRRLVATSAE